jgi:NAD(P)-dependent dehydrogenase (short-subunit alcohol dehydrogenase family)
VDSFKGRIAVVTGGGTGMGRELVLQLAAEGCNVATCDVQEEVVEETVERARKEAPDGTRVTAHRCDVSNASDMDRFRDEVVDQHATDHVNLVFNNAGIGGGGSFVLGNRDEWDKTFAVDWGGVYNGCRAFVPLLIASDDGYLVNTSSVNGFWAALGPGIAHTAYSAAKFAVKGFTEALLTDFAMNAPHVKVAVVMPGHIGTDIVANTQRLLTSGGLDQIRAGLERSGMLPPETSDDDLRNMMAMMAASFRDNAPLTAAQAATIILDGVRAGEWRILVGDDAKQLDEQVRANPVGAYGPDWPTLNIIQR